MLNHTNTTKISSKGAAAFFEPAVSETGLFVGFKQTVCLFFRLTTLLVSSNLFAQNALDNIGLGNNTSTAGAYALRKLTSAYVGKAIQVSKSTLSDTLSIGFTANGDLDTIALKNFVGSNSAYVTRWYDQSGRNKDLVINNSGNVYLVNAGVVYYSNNRPTLFFNGSSWLETTSSVINAANDSFTLNAVTHFTGSADVQRLFDQGSPGQEDQMRASLLRFYGELYFSGQYNDLTYQVTCPGYLSSMNILVRAAGSKGSVNEWADSSSIAPTQALNVPNYKVVVGRKNNNSEPFAGYLSELIVYNSCLGNADYYTLRTNQYGYYNIAYALPGTPSGITLAGGDLPGTLNINWTAPAALGNTVSGYVLNYRLQGTSAWTQKTITGQTTASVISGLIADTSYEVRLAATNAMGTGTYSATSPVRTKKAIQVSGPLYCIENKVSDTFYVRVPGNVSGDIAITAQGAGVNTSFLFSYSASAQTNFFVLNPTSTGVVQLTFSNTFGYAIVANGALNAIRENSYNKFDQVTGTNMAVLAGTRLLNTGYTRPVLRILMMPNSVVADVGVDSLGAVGNRSLVNIVDGGTSSWAVGQRQFLGDLLSSIQTGYCMIVYDQSGKANDAFAYSTNVAPVIISNGAFMLLNNLPTLYFDGSKFLRSKKYVVNYGNSSFSLNAVFQGYNGSSFFRIFDQGGTDTINKFSERRASMCFNPTNMVFSGENDDCVYGVSISMNTGVSASLSVSLPGSTAWINGGSSTNATTPRNILSVDTGFMVFGKKNIVSQAEALKGTISEWSVHNTMANTTKVQLITQIQASYYRIPSNLLPGTPSNLAATTAASPGVVLLTWSAPNQDGGNSITDYTVEYQVSGSGTWSAFTHTASPQTSIQVSGLTIGVLYDFRVSAKTAVGTGSASGVVSFRPVNNIYTVSGPCYGLVNVASASFTVTPASNMTGTVTITPSGGGLNVPVQLTFTNSSAPQTFTITPTQTGNVRLTMSNNAGFIDPPLPLWYTAASGGNRILDQLGAASGAAYSLRLLYASYTDKLLTLTNTSNGAEGDVYPDSSGVISSRSLVGIRVVGSSSWYMNQTLLLADFIASSNVNIKTWYDQSGNGRHMTQTTGSAQPVFAQSGTGITSNGLPALKFNGGQWLDCSNAIITPGSKNFTLNAVMKFVQNGSFQRIFDQGASIDIDNQRASMMTSGAGNLFYSGNFNDAEFFGRNWGSNLAIGTIVTTNPGSVGAVNGAAMLGGNPNQNINITNSPAAIGRKRVGYEYIIGNLSEMILLNATITPAARLMLEFDQGNYYAVTTIPSKPLAVSASNGVSGASIRLTWTRPAFQGNTLTGYKISYRITGSNSSWTTLTKGDSVSNYTVSGLTTGNTYDLFVAAVNAAGSGDSSNVVSFTLQPRYALAVTSYALVNNSVSVTVTPTGNITGSITITPSGVGSLSAQTLVFSGTSAAQVVSFTPTVAGTLILNGSNTIGMENPATALVTVSAVSDAVVGKITTAPLAAFGLRILKSSYTGALLTLRNRTTGALADVTADSSGVVSLRSLATIIDAGSSSLQIGQQVYLTTFADTSTCYVSKWYDQSGSAYHASQLTAAYQPVLFNNGSLIQLGNKAALSFSSGAQQFLSTPIAASSINASGTVMTVFKVDPALSGFNTNAILSWHPASGSSFGLALTAGNKLGMYATNTAPATQLGTVVAGGSYTGSVTWSNYGISNIACSVNGAFNTPASSMGSWFNASIASANIGYDNNYFSGMIAELLIYGSSLSSPDIKFMEANQADCFNTAYVGTSYWKGTTSNPQTSGNWLPGAVPTAIQDIVVQSGQSAQPIVSSGTLACNNLTLMTGTTLTVNSGASLKLAGAIVINGNPILLNGTLELSGTTAQSIGGSKFQSATIANLTLNNPSNVTVADSLKISGVLLLNAGTLNTGNLITILADSLYQGRIGPVSGTMNGNLTMQQFVSGLGAAGPRWRFVSAFINGKTFSDYQNFVHITGPGSGNTVGTKNSAGFDATLSNNPSVYGYDETVVTDINNSGSNDYNDGWTTPASINTPLGTGKGYRMYIRGNRADGISLLNGSNANQSGVKFSLNGAINTGNVNMPVTYTNSGNSVSDGWNLLGNPYPCTVNWNLVHDPGRVVNGSDFSGSTYSHIDPVIYLFDAVINGYRSYNALSDAGSLSNGMIPAGAAFFVKATAAAPSLLLKENQKSIGDSAVKNVFKTTLPLLRVTMEGSKQAGDVFLLQLNTASGLNFDPYDIAKLYNPEVNISSADAGGIELSLSAIPEVTPDTHIPLSMSASSEGLYRLTFDGINELGREVYLLNLVTQEKILLTEGHSIDITLLKSQRNKNRQFELVFGEPTGAAVQRMLEQQLVVFPNPLVNRFGLSGIDLTGATCVLFDANGREIPLAANEAEFDISNLEPGYYLLEIRLGNTVIRKPVLKTAE